LILAPNARVGQMVFFKADTSRKYEGVYNRERSSVWTDGSVSGKAGHKKVTCSFKVEGGDGIQIFDLPPEETVNVAEYMGVIKALVNINSFQMDIISDSRLVVCQINTRLKKNKPEDKMETYEPRLLALQDKVVELCAGRKVTFTWMDRSQNKADTGVKK